MEAPSLFVRNRPDGEPGLYLKNPAARDTVILMLDCDFDIRTALGTFPPHGHTHVRSNEGLHDFIHHRCVPTCYVDWAAPGIRALRDLREGEEITLNFLAVFDWIKNAFPHRCGGPLCLGRSKAGDVLGVVDKAGVASFLPARKQVRHATATLRQKAG